MSRALNAWLVTSVPMVEFDYLGIQLMQISFSCLVCPAILAAYCGQAAYLMKHPDHVDNTFYDSIPGM